jgi:hypothetical protein
MKKTVDKYTQQADEARAQAEKCVSPDDMARWLRIAEEWLKLASEVEARAKTRI